MASSSTSSSPPPSENHVASSLADTWLSEATRARESQTLITALQSSLLSPSASNPFPVNASVDHRLSPSSTTTTTTNNSNSNSNNTMAKGNDAVIFGPRGRVEKRRESRRASSKRSNITFIAADPINFRDMVQQVTGVKFPGGGDRLTPAVILKPEPQRLGSRRWGSGGVGGGGGGPFPTLDTSAFLESSIASLNSSIGPGPHRGPITHEERFVGDYGVGVGVGLDFVESLANYPTTTTTTTLDSFNVVM